MSEEAAVGWALRQPGSFDYHMDTGYWSDAK